MTRKPPLHALSIYLLKETYKSVDSALRKPETVDVHELRGTSGVEGVVVVKGSNAKAPRWVDFLSPHLKDSQALAALRNSSSGAALFLESAGRTFVMTFGQGRHLVKPESYVHDFGLRVVLNVVEPSRLKSVDARTIDELTIHTQLDISREASFEAFGLDVSRDLVRSVTGQPREESVAHRATGADVLAIQTRAIFEQLPGLCRRLLDEYRAEHYKENFAWIDHLRFERDPSVVEDLEKQLEADIGEREITNLHLAPPDNLDWQRLPRFTFSTRRPEALDPDPRITGYLESLPEDADIDVGRLKRDRVEAFDADGQFMGSWSVYSCLVYETQSGDNLFVLSAGDWYRVDVAFAQTVSAYVNALPRLSVSLPDASVGMTEADYNTMAAGAVDALCMDRQLIRQPFPTGIELCDLLTRSNQLIHIKKRGSSATLSHLFAQGLVSAQLIAGDQDFRTEARSVVRALDPSFEAAVPDNPPGRDDYEVGFAVISRGKASPGSTLPFFSQVNLQSQAKLLQGLGFRVSFVEVPER